MKKLKLLFMACAMLGSSAAAWAQTDGNYYLYDSADGLFLTRGDNYNTRATLGPGGCPIEYKSADKTLRFLDFNNYLFATNDGQVYTDNTTNNTWEFETVDGGGYKIKNVNKGTYIGKTNPGNPELYRYSLIQTENSSDAVVWYLLTPTEYKTKQAELTTLNYQHIIKDANLTCTPENFVTTLSSDSYSAKDVTSNIATSVINKDEWTVQADAPNDYNGCECFQRAGALKRTVTGLPSGIYKISLNGFERSNGFEACNTFGESGIEISTAFLKANTEEVAFKSWYSDKTDTSNPNSVSEAKTKFNDGKYQNDIYCYVGSDGQLKLSINYFAKSAAGRWVIFNNLKVTYYVSVAEYNTALEAAKAAKANADYANITGKELTDLTTTIDTYSSNVSDYAAAVKALNDATSAFIAAKDAYDALVNENTKAARFDLNGYTITEETTAAIAIEKVKEIKVQVFNKVKTDYPTAIQLGEWIQEGPTGEMSSQHWDGSGQGGTKYLEQSGEAYGQNSWDITFSQTITLPKGAYVFKMTGRHGSNNGPLNNTMSLIVNEGENEIGIVNDFPVGDTGLGVNKNGETSFDPNDAAGFANNNNGRGWEWRYVPFTLTEEKAITIMIKANATAVNQWCSFCNYSVVATADNTFAALIAYNQKIEEAKKAIEEHPDVKGKELAELNALIEAIEPSTLEEIKNATTALETAISTFIAAEEGWKRYAIATETATAAGVNFQDISADDTKTSVDAFAEANNLFTASINSVKDVNTEGKTLGFEAGEWTLYLIQPSITYVNTLLAEGGEADAEKVKAADATAMKDAVTAIKGWKANEAEINAIANGNFANVDIESTGWKATNWRQIEHHSYGTICSAAKGASLIYGESENDAFKLSLKPNTVYTLTFKHASWDGGNQDKGGTVSVVNNNNDGLQNASFKANSKTKNDENPLLQETYIFKTGATQSNYVLTISQPGDARAAFTDFEIKKAVAEDNITIDEAEAYTPEAKYANVTLKRKFVDGWNGLVLPFDMTIDEAKAKFNATDVKDFAGITTGTEGTTLNFTDATEIKAGKPVMIKTSSTDTEYTIENAWLPGTELTGVSKENGDVKYTFTGTYAEENLAGKKFTLINGKYFYNYDGTESTVKAKSFRAYFLNKTPETAAAKSKIIGFNLDGDITGISEIKAGSKNDGKMFDMQGRRVLSPAKGLYIQNGKKVIVK